jgi:hypothetical protein
MPKFKMEHLLSTVGQIRFGNIHEFRGGGMGGGGLKYPLPPYEIFVKGYPPPKWHF